MAKSKIPYESLSISDKIEVKRKKIQRLFRDLPAERKQFADGLIYQFAVTTVTLERLVEEINAGDLIEDFKQGAQRYAAKPRPSRATIRRSSRLPPSRKASSTSSRRKLRNRPERSL